MNRCAALTVAPVLLMLGGVACAQTTPPVGPPVQAAPSSPDHPNCTPDARAATPDSRSSTDASGQPNLSDRLASRNGVICPPDVDPQMRVPPPGGGRMLVVPPPGGPGGDPNTIPK